MKENYGEQAMKGFLQAYLGERNLHKAVSYLDKKVQWIGTGAEEHSCSYQETVSALQEELLTEPWPYGYRFQTFQCTQIDEKTQTFFILLTAASRSPEFDASSIPVRITAACHLGENGWKIVSIHFSTPNIQQAVGEYYPGGWKEEERSFSRDMRGSFLDILNRSISGGMIGCYLQPGLPVYYINQNMLDYLGYAYDEFEKATGNLIANCVHPEDWPGLDNVITQAMKKDQEYDVRYRIRKRDGAYIWVSDIGKKAWNENGVPICIGVVRDITEEIAAKDELEQESLEKKRQAEEYSHIFNSVFCGIVQYRMDREGRVEFVKANREAIRIFGYPPEEFWRKPDWNLPDLIVEEDRAATLKAAMSMKAPGETSQFEYRLRQKNGAPLWVIGTAEVMRAEPDGTMLVQSVFLDIHKQKMMEQENKELLTLNEGSNELLRLALINTSIYEFYYYPKGFRVVYPKRTGDYFQLPEKIRNVPGYLMRHMAADESKGELIRLFREIRKGARRAAAEFRDKNGRWSRITMSAIQENDRSIPTVMVGLVENITKEKEMELALERARSLDSATGLYNKEAGLKKIRDYMEKKAEDQVCAIMVLDLDDFKKLNDEEGWVFGDAILAEVADVLKSSIGPEDIALRLGGDEFMLFVKNCSKQRAGHLGPMIAQRIKGICYNQEKGLHVSASIGMCVTEVVDEYNGLYRCAESTLQYVKKHGKGAAACYLDVSNELGAKLIQVYTEEHLLNEIISKSSAEKRNIADTALEFLSKAKRLDDAVGLLLAKVGKSYQLDRVSIVEIERDYHSFHYSYQWAREKNDLQMGNTYYIKPGRLEELSRDYDADGLCGWKFHDESPMASCLRCAIWDSGICTGHLGFESRQKDFSWTQEHRKTLKELTQVISTFVAKAHSDAVSLAKTQFLSRMSHEIRTPMNAIAGMTTIAKASLDNREKALDCLNKIERSNQYLLGLINDILEVSRIESGKIEINPEWVGMVSVERQLNEMLSPQAKEKNVSLLFDGQCGEEDFFYLDTLRFNQIFINLIGNAIKFTEPGGTVAAQAKIERIEKDVAYIRFSVADTGIGIAPEALGRIFRSFEQESAITARQFGGTGLGLTISSRLVQLMGGELKVKSQLGEGSEFYFTLSLKYRRMKPAGQAALKEQKKAETPVHGDGKRLLVVEDNKLNMEIAVTLLEMEGFQLETAQNGREAVDLYLKNEPYYFDAVLMDIQMPVMNGLEATKAIRISEKEDARTIPVIAMTANAFDEDARQSIQYGMNGHISKPFTVEHLLETLSACFRKKEGEDG